MSKEELLELEKHGLDFLAMNAPVGLEPHAYVNWLVDQNGDEGWYPDLDEEDRRYRAFLFVEQIAADAGDLK